MKFTSYKDRELFDTRHGGAFDRGSADSYYQRGIEPHLFLGDSYNSRKVEEFQMTKEQLKEYMAGYFWNEQFGDKKDWS
jgi:hypothetical protein